MEKKRAIDALDIRTGVCVLICVAVSTLLNHFNLRFPYGEMRLEIIQKMTAAIGCILCCQESTEGSKKAGINRIIITVIGGVLGVIVTLIDTAVKNEILMVLMIAFGVVCALMLGKTAKVPYVTAKIGGATFILVACTLQGHARIWYAVMRLITTVFAAIVVYCVTVIFDKAGWTVSKEHA